MLECSILSDSLKSCVLLVAMASNYPADRSNSIAAVATFLKQIRKQKSDEIPICSKSFEIEF